MPGLRLEPDRLEVRTGRPRSPGADAPSPPAPQVVAVVGSGRYELGDLVVELDLHADGSGLSWALGNAGGGRAAVTSVRLVLRLVEVVPPVRILSHGYQSWSPTRVRTLGVDLDPSRAQDTIPVLRAWHHADGEVVEGDELRSELVTVVVDGSAQPWTLGFLGGHEHDGTFRLRHAGDGDRVELACEAYLGGVELSPGERRRLHDVQVADGDPHVALERWADAVGHAAGARVDAPYQVGWCSWYHYFHDVTEEAFLANLAQAADWPFEVFQLDDGYQATVGDWLRTNERFPTSLDDLADRVDRAGRRPGIWLAPFVARPDASVFVDHRDWFAEYEPGQPLIVHLNPGWGGEVYGLDTTRPEVLDHLEATARALVEAGFTYLKLDFTYAPSIAGRWADPTCTPAQRVRAGYEAVRRGAGADAFLLACGAPLGPVVGLVDGMRIGPDVAPSWDVEGFQLPGYAETQPATVNAWRNTLARAFQHRRLWLCDPDCLMLRTTETRLGEAGMRAWADAVAVSGGMALVSDDLGLLDAGARSILERTVSIGREVDDDARRDATPRCDDLLDRDPPTVLTAGEHRLVADLAGPRAEIRTRRTG